MNFLKIKFSLLCRMIGKRQKLLSLTIQVRVGSDMRVQVITTRSRYHGAKDALSHLCGFHIKELLVVLKCPERCIFLLFYELEQKKLKSFNLILWNSMLKL